MACNIPREVQDSLRDVLDRRQKITFKCLLRHEIRPEKYDTRVLAFSNWRLIILIARPPCKIEHSFHYIDILAIESFKRNQLSLTIEGKTYNFLSFESDVEQIDFIITHIGVSLKSIFSSVPLDRLIKKIDVLPHERLNLMQDMIKDKEKKDPGPCGGFSNMYACMCDYHHLPYRDDVAWDVDTIYLSHDTKELRLKDFDHLQSRDWLPIISTLEYNSWFTGINANNVRLTNDVATEVVKVMKKNSVLEELSVSNTGIKSDLVQKLSVALLSNSGTQLAKVDLSCNVLDDRGVIHFLGSLSKLSRGLTDLDLSKTGLTGKGINKLAETMCGSSVIRNSLKTLKISDNPVKGDDVTNLYRFLSLPNVLTHLDFSGLEIPLEVLSAALLRGCTQHMTHLNLSRNPFTLKKLKDVTIPQSWKQLFSSFYQLSHLDLSHCKLPMESVKELLLGISSNMNISSLHLDLSSNELYSSSSDEIDTIIAHMSNLTSLDISNNRFELSLEHFLKSVSQNKTLKHLAIGRNFSGMKVKHLPRVLGAVVQLLQEENSAIESLSLADSKLKGETTLVINALGSNKTLTELDISGNSMEDVGARMLAKALQINNKLQTIIWDKNGTTAQGFQDIADALEQNYTLKKMPTPVFDATAAIKYQPEKVEATLQKIECLLQRNHSPRKFSSDQGYRLQQGFLISSTQQMVDRLVVQMQDTMNALTIDSSSSSSSANIEQASRYIDDANNCQQLLPQLQKIAIKSQEVGNPVEQKLNSMVEELHEVLNSHVENTVSDMLECAKTQCSAVLSNESFLSDLEADVAEKRKLPKDIVSQVLGDVSTDIFNRLSDLNLVIAARLSDRILEGVIESLSKSHKQLTNELNVKKRYRFSGSFDTDKNEKADLEIPSEKHSEKAALEDHEKESPTLKCSPGYSPKLNTKKKSLYGRKLRPQSVIDHDAVQQALKNHSDKTLRSHGEDEEEAEDSGVGSSSGGGGGIRHTITESPEMMNRSTVSSGSDISLSSVLSQAGSSPRHPDLGPNRMTKSAIDYFDMEESIDLKPDRNQSLDSLAFDPSVISMTTSVNSLTSVCSSLDLDIGPTQKLHHINKARPKRKKNHIMTKSQGHLVSEANGMTDEGIENFYTPPSVMKETNSVPEDVGKSPKEKSSLSDSRHSSMGEADRVATEKTSDGSPKIDSKPDVKKKTWNLFSRDRGKISIFAKKPKGDSPKMKHAQMEDKTETVKETQEIKDDYEEGGEKVSRSSPATKSENKESADIAEKPRKMPMIPVMDENVLAEMKKKREIRTSLKDLTVSATNGSDVGISAKDEESPTKQASRNSCHLATENLSESSGIAIAQEDKTKQCINLDKYFPSSEDIGSKENQSPSKDKHVPVPLAQLNRRKSTEKPAEKLTEDHVENSLEKTGAKTVAVSKMEEKSAGVKMPEKSDFEKKSEGEVSKAEKEVTGKPAATEEPMAPMKPKPVPRTKSLLTAKLKPPPPVAPKPAVPSRPSIRKTSNPNTPSATTDAISKDASGVVYDSSTLRLSVKEKISWLSQTNSVKTPTETNDKLEESEEDVKGGKKSSSLPRNSQIPAEFKDADSEVQSRPYSMYCEMPNELSNQSSRSTASCSSLLSSHKKDSSSNSSLPPLSKVPNPQLLNLSTDGLDTSRLSMCSSHHSSTDEVESDGEIIFL